MNRLAVTVFDEHCGSITPGNGLDYSFSYEPSWRPDARHGISLSMPRSDGGVVDDRARAYFGGLLPEGAARRHLAQASGIDELDDIALLRLLGHECPGAIRVLSDDGGADETNASGGVDDVQWLEPSRLDAFIASLRVPGSAGAVDRYSISLAGAQLKRAVIVGEGGGGTPRYGLPSGATLSTHIVKLAVADYDGIVHNEHAMQLLAAAVGIKASRTRVVWFGDEPVLLVERYDRISGVDGLRRLHQEDMCQALGRLSSHKYERYDAVTKRAVGPTIVDMVELLRTHVRPSIQQVDELLRLVWFNVMVGNVDAHAKNYSLLYERDLDAIEIAPLYDSICITAHHGEMSLEQRKHDEPLVMNIGGQTRFWHLERRDVEQLANALRIRPGYMVEQVLRMVDRVDGAIHDVVDMCQSDDTTSHPILELVRVEVTRRCEHLRRALG